MVTMTTRDEVEMKSGGYADDVHVLCEADDDSVKGLNRAIMNFSLTALIAPSQARASKQAVSSTQKEERGENMH